MILTGAEIKRQHEFGRIELSDFDERNLTTNSYDLRLGPCLLRYTCEVLDPKRENPTESLDIPAEGFQLRAGDFVLGQTAEVIGSDYYVPLIHARSGTARLGLFVHVTADLFDIGAHVCSTLQLYATLPVRLYAYMKIAQVTFWVPRGKVDLYSGKYKGSRRPMPSLSFHDFT